MYVLRLSDSEYYDSSKNEFITIPGKAYKLEHSLISISKWEAKWHRAFLSKDSGPKTRPELLDYVRCMCINEEIPDYVLQTIPNDKIEDVFKYINDPMTATTFSNKRRKGRVKQNSFVTSEVLYWQMSMYSIPYKCEQWHLNRLLTLLRVCDEKGQTPQKMSERDILKQYAGVNASRRKPRK